MKTKQQDRINEKATTEINHLFPVFLKLEEHLCEKKS